MDVELVLRPLEDLDIDGKSDYNALPQVFLVLYRYLLKSVKTSW